MSWLDEAGAVGARYDKLTRRVNLSCLGLMIIVGTTVRVAGEDAHEPGPFGARFVVPAPAAND